MKFIDCKILRIYLKESDKFEGQNMTQTIIKLLKSRGISGATVFKAQCGYGRRGVSRFDILRLSMNLPVIIECIDYETNFKKVLPELTKVVGENGLITMENIQVVK
ncbi:DUF190 domain-containing protein [Methanococcus voltae]|uniref:Uncharacterized protein n=1 Tax=Methanococcus voltae (strain ATCC BAA-1334 / A3) TaxID=456320 RepID=D7DRD9_METV3|nr:DUF190 domain-containing protein [Methanococcus voltae]MCS3901076.1 PII-like signaling protein [Methanococcus voltae]